MATTIKRITLALTKEDLRQLDELSKMFEEDISKIIKRGIILLYYLSIDKYFYIKK